MLQRIGSDLFSHKDYKIIIILKWVISNKFQDIKEELRKLKYFTMQKYIIFKKNPQKETKILQDILTL